jgi:hypothetical protein
MLNFLPNPVIRRDKSGQAALLPLRVVHAANATNVAFAIFTQNLPWREAQLVP